MLSRRSAFLPLAALFFTACFATAAEPLPWELLENGRKALQRYARDTTETPLDVKTTISVFDTKDKLRKSRTTTHRFEVTTYRHHPEEGTSSRMRSTIGLRNPIEQFNTDASAFFLFLSLEREDTEFSFPPPSTPGSVRIAWNTGSNCISFTYGRRGAWFAPIQGFWLQGPCGAGEVTFDERTFAPLRSTFTAASLPLTVGKKTLRAFKAEQEFQAIELPDTKQPLILPKTVVATFDTNTGTTVVRSEYSVRRTRQ